MLLILLLLYFITLHEITTKRMSQICHGMQADSCVKAPMTPWCATCGARVRIARVKRTKEEKRREGARGAQCFAVACLRWHPYNETIDFHLAMGYPDERAITTKGRDVGATR